MIKQLQAFNKVAEILTLREFQRKHNNKNLSCVELPLFSKYLPEGLEEALKIPTQSACFLL